MKYAAIDSMRQRYPISMLCELLEVSRSGYHEWRCRAPSARQRANERLSVRSACCTPRVLAAMAVRVFMRPCDVGVKASDASEFAV